MPAAQRDADRLPHKVGLCAFAFGIDRGSIVAGVEGAEQIAARERTNSLSQPIISFRSGARLAGEPTVRHSVPVADQPRLPLIVWLPLQPVIVVELGPNDV